MVTDQDRRDLYVALEQQLGPGPAATLMELLPPVSWTDLARRSDLVAIRGEMAELGAELRTEMAELRTELRSEMAELRTELRGEMAALRTELRGEMADLRTELRTQVAGVRGEIAELRARVEAQLPRFLLANLPIVFGTAGLVLAGAKLL